MYIYRLLTNFGDGVSREGLLNVLAFLVALVVALVLHELAHGLVAFWNGDDTAKVYGRLTLNPVKHFDLFGFLMLLFVGFGWARPVPVNPANFKKRRFGCITVSLAGVVTNLLLAFFFALPEAALGGMMVEYNTSMYFLLYFVHMTCFFIVALNISFALFNLLPLFQLDGYRLLSCFVDERKRGMKFLRKYSLYIMLGLLVWDSVCDLVSALEKFSPYYWYIQCVGGWIRTGFLSFWGLIL